jgi:enamine deaminase RidA (YjgF/YER057c/UK114 family)
MIEQTATAHEQTIRSLRAVGLDLPATAAPVAAYVPAVVTGNLVYTSGQLPLVKGVLAATGKVGDQISVEVATELARICTLNALAAAAGVIDLDRVVRVVKVVGFVASATGFTQQPAVIDGASKLLRSLLGESGQHARSAVGVAELPLGAPVEVELVLEFS